MYKANRIAQFTSSAFPTEVRKKMEKTHETIVFNFIDSSYLKGTITQEKFFYVGKQFFCKSKIKPWKKTCNFWSFGPEFVDNLLLT